MKLKCKSESVKDLVQGVNECVRILSWILLVTDQWLLTPYDLTRRDGSGGEHPHAPALPSPPHSDRGAGGLVLLPIRLLTGWATVVCLAARAGQPSWLATHLAAA